jgi:hypothetical protein
MREKKINIFSRLNSLGVMEKATEYYTKNKRNDLIPSSCYQHKKKAAANDNPILIHILSHLLSFFFAGTVVRF